MAAPLQMASAIFLLATKVMCAPSAIKAEQNTSSTRLNIPQLESENIRESILNFTVLLGEINPDMLYCILHRDKETNAVEIVEEYELSIARVCKLMEIHRSYYYYQER